MDTLSTMCPCAWRGQPDFGALPRTEDGTALALFDPGLILESITSPGTVKVNFADYQWIGALLRDVRVCYASVASGVRIWNDMIKRSEFLIGNTAKGSNAYVAGAILRKNAAHWYGGERHGNFDRSYC